MSDEEGNVSVSARRAKIQEKLGLNGFTNGRKTTIRTEEEPPNVPAVPPPQSPPLDRNRSPPVPAHKSLSPENVRSPPLRPPPPPHRTDPERRSSAAKPPIAPKPEIRKLSTVTITPSIVVESSTDDANSNGNFSREGSVRTRAKELEHLGLKLRNGSVSSGSDAVSIGERPASMVSTTSAQSELTDSDSDDGRPSEMLRTMGIEIFSAGRMNLRRPSALCFNGDSGMHDKIMDELKRQGVVRSSSHQGIYKKKADTDSPLFPRRRMENNNDTNVEMTAAEENEGIPNEIGKMRDEKKLRQPDVTLSMASTSTTQSDESYERDHNDTTMTDRSSFMSEYHPEVKDYNTGDPAEDKRLKKLHYAANEFYSVQQKFVKYLHDMEVVYPNYVAEFGRRLGKDLLSPPPGLPIHPVRQIQTLFQQLRPTHQIFLEQFATQYAKWNSEEPGLSAVFHQYADFLKICIPFLQAKGNLVIELSKLREENKDFDNATVAFEQKIFQRGVGAVVQQLDQVHQNFMRHKILMMSYQNYLVPDSEEHKQATGAIQKLEKIAQQVNGVMGLPTNEELFQLYDRFQTHFNVFAPGRRLIRQGDALKQTRKECQHRYVVLFSDVLWICRVASLSSGLFDLNRSYSLAIEAVRTQTVEHEDFETHLLIKSKEKSFRLVFKSAKEMKQWNQDICTAREEKRRYKRRMSAVAEKEKRQNSITPLFKQPTLTEECNEDASSSKENGTPACLSRSQSVDTPSQPSTPVGEVPPGITSFSNLNGSRKVRRPEKEKPLWIPDEASSKCLMENCGTVFGFVNRRHHCRDCGYLICSKCSGRAPLSKYDFKKELVCPECYGKILEKYTKGVLFPERILVKTSNDLWRVRVKKGKSGNVLVEPRSLFSAPVNMGLKRMSVEERVSLPEDAVFNEVFVKTRDGTEMSRFALLTDGMILKFFRYRLDDEPCEQHVIYGFDLHETQLDEGGTLFELVHRNQIQTDRREHVIVFRVQHEKSVQKWSAALRSTLGLSKDDES